MVCLLVFSKYNRYIIYITTGVEKVEYYDKDYN